MCRLLFPRCCVCSQMIGEVCVYVCERHDSTKHVHTDGRWMWRPPWCCRLLSAPAMSDEEHQIAPEQQTDVPLDAADPSSPEKRERKQGELCGLQNIGNPHHVNFFLQTLFLVPGFVDCVLRYREESELPAKSERETTDGAASGEGTMADGVPLGEESARRHSSGARGRGRTASQSLVLELRRLFAHMLLSKRKCVSPENVLAHLVDENGRSVPLGTQEDVGQLSSKFFERLEEDLMQGAVMPPRWGRQHPPPIPATATPLLIPIHRHTPALRNTSCSA
mmetsp:Transcript_36643/g.104943  ORF Transcript_36643/g.104943 Transcript_36643/m.104943 type:complete len:279 (-) Transcript_36643:2454-3290(-)